MPRHPGAGLTWFFWLLHSLDSVGRSVLGTVELSVTLVSGLGLIRMSTNPALPWLVWGGPLWGFMVGHIPRQKHPRTSLVVAAVISRELWSPSV